MINIYLNDNTYLKLDLTKVNNYEDIKKFILENKYNNKFYISLNDVILISFGKIITNDSEFNIQEKQILLAYIKINKELHKIVNDDRFINLLNDENMKNILYEILDDPTKLEKIKTYKYQHALNDIQKMGFEIPENKLKLLLDKNYGNIENTISQILS